MRAGTVQQGSHPSRSHPDPGLTCPPIWRHEPHLRSRWKGPPKGEALSRSGKKWTPGAFRKKGTRSQSSSDRWIKGQHTLLYSLSRHPGIRDIYAASLLQTHLLHERAHLGGPVRVCGGCGGVGALCLRLPYPSPGLPSLKGCPGTSRPLSPRFVVVVTRRRRPLRPDPLLGGAAVRRRRVIDPKPGPDEGLPALQRCSHASRLGRAPLTPPL